jgi:multidrug resistance efflux pump
MSDADGHPPVPARAPAKRRLTRRTKICTALILALALLEGSALTIRYFLTDHRFVIADNAKVDGDEIEIHAPTDGRVVEWHVDTGSSVSANQVVGRVEILGNAARPRMPIKSPGRGTVVQNTVSNGM